MAPSFLRSVHTRFNRNCCTQGYMYWNISLYPERYLFKVIRFPTVNHPVSSVIRRTYSNSNNSLPAAPQFATLASPEHINEARSWISSFRSRSIARGAVELSFSRSSGPGGQVCSNDSCILF
jgi:hypothetical protein